MNEHDLIAMLRPLAGPAALDLRDDAALLAIPAGHELVISTDTMVEGVHFPSGWIGGDFAERLLRTALSDLAAKAARPIGYSLNLSWPSGRDERFVKGFVTGLRAAQEAFDCPLIGGDTTSTEGPLVASATVYGLVPEGRMVTRSGAGVGDILFHTGRLGDAEIGLRLALGDKTRIQMEEYFIAEEAYRRPTPRLLFRKVLREFATACADLSDGIMRDAHNIAMASGVRLDLTRNAYEAGRHGDDYELLFTVPPDCLDDLKAGAKAVSVYIERCGTVLEGSGVTVDGETIQGEPSGYAHKL